MCCLDETNGVTPDSLKKEVCVNYKETERDPDTVMYSIKVVAHKHFGLPLKLISVDSPD